MVKRIQVSREGGVLEPRVQLYNRFNHANLDLPDTPVGTSVFGRIFGPNARYRGRRQA